MSTSNVCSLIVIYNIFQYVLLKREKKLVGLSKFLANLVEPEIPVEVTRIFNKISGHYKKKYKKF